MRSLVFCLILGLGFANQAQAAEVSYFYCATLPGAGGDPVIVLAIDFDKRIISKQTAGGGNVSNWQNYQENGSERDYTYTSVTFEKDNIKVIGNSTIRKDEKDVVVFSLSSRTSILYIINNGIRSTYRCASVQKLF
jgi:hypothetical protein